MRFWSLLHGAVAVVLDCGPLRVHQLPEPSRLSRETLRLQLGRMQNYQRLACPFSEFSCISSNSKHTRTYPNESQALQVHPGQWRRRRDGSWTRALQWKMSSRGGCGLGCAEDQELRGEAALEAVS